ncbi:hypothetical protein ACFOYU_11810 [Microvirga sp. GCM10011540]|nr:hypothetical protein [Microvirga lenta]
MATYWRIGLTVAAFALIAGIIAAPIFPKLGSPDVVASTPHQGPAPRLPVSPASLQTD